MSELFTAKPTADRKAWMVYDMYNWPPAPIFIGSMEGAGLVADKKNARPPHPPTVGEGE